MAITLDGMVRNAEFGQKAGVSASTKAELATGAHDLPSQRAGQSLGATNVQLSVYGQVKSSFAEVQSTGRTLSTPSKIGTIEDATKAVQDFAEAYNNAARIANTAAKSESQASSPLANLATNDLKKVLTSGNHAAELKKIGLSLNQDGTVSVDAKELQSAMQSAPAQVQDTLAKVGAQAAQVSQNQFAGTNLGGAINPFGALRARNPEAKPTGQQPPASDAAHALQQPTQNVGSKAGIAAYSRMLAF